MKFINTILVQTNRNLQKTWPTQFMTLLTVTLSVLIFSFFFLIYTNMIKTGEKLGDDLRLTIYLEEEPVLEMQAQLVRKIINSLGGDIHLNESTGDGTIFKITFYS